MRPASSLRPSLLAALTAFLLPAGASAQGFDWGQDCDSGTGQFDQAISWYATETVGSIPVDKADVRIDLTSAVDVDVQLIDAATGTEIIAWPDGLLNGASEACTWWQGVEYCWSGYNGDQSPGGYGNEWIEVHGATNRELVMKAFGYQAGAAVVEYSFEPVPTCNEVGDGAFTQYVGYYQTVTVGTIPQGKTNVLVELDAGAGRDLDVQLWDGATPIVHWPNGLLNGATADSVEYEGMTIEWSGYNGIGGNWGHETIEITGELTADLTVKAFAFQSGTADVVYEWGVGVGSTCLGIATLQCPEGLYCKDVQVDVSDPAGGCHTYDWCLNDAQASADCANVIHPMAVGFFSCETFQCQYNICGANNPRFTYVSTDPAQCQVIRYFCPPGQAPFSNTCGCGCKQ